MIYNSAMKKVFPFTSLILLFPLVTNAQGIQSFLTNLTEFLGEFVVLFLMAMAFLFFTINVIRYFVLGSKNEDDREKAKALAIYSVLAFVLIVTFWGIINMLAESTGLEGETAPVSDYVAGS